MTVFIALMIVFGLISGYIITSFILLKFPKLIHKKKQLAFKAVHISHRGGAGENIENTLEAFKYAVSIGTNMLELDCHLSKDGEVVVCHDDKLQRTTGVDVTIRDTDYKEFPFLHNFQNLDFAHDHVTQTDDKELKIPLLRHVFENFPQTAVNIDIKVDSDELIQKICDLIKQYSREGMTVWGSRYNNVCLKCYAMNSNIPIFFSLKRVVIVLLLFYSGLLPFVPLKESCYEICMFSILLERNRFTQVVDKKWRCVIHVLDFLMMNRHLFQHLEDRGIQVYLWVLNNEAEYQRALNYRATGIMTDFPTRLRDFLVKKNLMRCTDDESSPLRP